VDASEASRQAVVAESSEAVAEDAECLAGLATPNAIQESLLAALKAGGPTLSPRAVAAVAKPAAPRERAFAVDSIDPARLAEMAEDAAFWIRVELNFGEPRRHQKGQMRVRVTLDARLIHCVLQVDVAARGAMTAASSELVVRDGEEEFPPLELFPELAGQHRADVQLRLLDPMRRPVAQWSGREFFDVADVRQRQGNVNINLAEANVFGGVDVESMLKTQEAERASWTRTDEEWHDLAMRFDTSFGARVKRSLPPAPWDQPPVSVDSAIDIAGQSPVHARFVVIHPRSGREMIYLDAGEEITAGRDRHPDLGVSWPLRLLVPADKDPKHVSNRHFSLQLRHDRAWVIDHSSCGLWLNDRPLRRDDPMVLADGDLLQARHRDAGVKLSHAMKVRVLGNSDTVSAVALRVERDLALGAAPSILFILAGGEAVNVAPLFQSEKSLWIATTGTQDGVVPLVMTEAQWAELRGPTQLRTVRLEPEATH
jgi:hypothetical protein